jgi:anti-sigma B factor antagonist
MKLEMSTQNGAAGRTVVVRGDVDMDSSPELRDEIKRSLKGAPALRLDLKGVSYMDSSGIAVLIQALRWANQQKTPFKLVDPSPQVKGVIELSQLHTVFDIETSVG